jgi:Ni,Fe-hydrogenase I large subunit
VSCLVCRARVCSRGAVSQSDDSDLDSCLCKNIECGQFRKYVAGSAGPHAGHSHDSTCAVQNFTENGQSGRTSAPEGPRRGLGHWIVIENGKTANYQAVVPSTWNAGPCDHQGQAGAYEAALKGHAVHDGKQPLEVLRTIHSFDPCIACAVHVVELETTQPASDCTR